jgi:hypothetical protein
MGSPLKCSCLLAGLLFGCPVFAQIQHSPSLVIVDSNLPDAPRSNVPTDLQQQSAEQRGPGTVTGTLVDQNGAAVVGAHVKLKHADESPAQEVTSDEDGRYFITNVKPGPFVLTIAIEGFATQSFSGFLRSAESYSVPQLRLSLATNVTEVRVELSQIEVAQEQMKDEEKQRLLGVFPNFYVTYVPNAAPLTSRQKFNLAWKDTIDPVTFLITGGVAGIQQARNNFSGYGQGAQGYAKRYAAAYADDVISTYIGSAILPSLLKQDPRYFYKGTGTVRSRIYYAIANSVICKGDNGHWQFNYSQIGGSLAAGGISNLYYPASDRNGVALTFENTLIGIGGTAAANLFQEFVFKRFTSHVPSAPGSNPSSP